MRVGEPECAVVLVPEGEAAILVLGIGPRGLLRALRPAMETNERLHMLRGAVQPDIEEVGLILGSGDAGQGSDLGVIALSRKFSHLEVMTNKCEFVDPMLVKFAFCIHAGSG